MTYQRRRRQPEQSTFRKWFMGAAGVLMAIVLAMTLFAGGCCGILVSAANTIDEQQKEQAK